MFDFLDNQDLQRIQVHFNLIVSLSNLGSIQNKQDLSGEYQ